MAKNTAPGAPHFQVGNAAINRVALLTNPAAGKGRAANIAQVAMEQLNHRGVDVMAIQGADADGARQLAEQMINDDQIDALVVAGGDGLVSLALQEQAGSGKPLGIIPSGTGNDHAREFGIPTDPIRAANVVADGFWSTSDLGRMHKIAPGQDLAHAGELEFVDSKWFGTIVCNGFDSLVTDRTNNIPWPRGAMRYNLAILLEFLNFSSIPTQMVLDVAGTDAVGNAATRTTPPVGAEEVAPWANPKVISENATLVAIGNTRSYGGGMFVTPDADHHDGLLDVTFLGRMSRMMAAWKFRKIFSGDISGEEGVSQYRARRVRIDMPKMNAYADGEKFNTLPIEVDLVRGAGKFLVPRP